MERGGLERSTRTRRTRQAYRMSDGGHEVRQQARGLRVTLPRALLRRGDSREPHADHGGRNGRGRTEAGRVRLFHLPAEGDGPARPRHSDAESPGDPGDRPVRPDRRRRGDAPGAARHLLAEAHTQPRCDRPEGRGRPAVPFRNGRALRRTGRNTISERNGHPLAQANQGRLFHRRPSGPGGPRTGRKARPGRLRQDS